MAGPAVTGRFWLFGIVAGVAIATAVTVFVTAWEWLENPGGLFHGDGGTRWDVVLDTAISWFLPTFGYAALIAAAGHLCWSAFRRWGRQSEPGER